MMRRRAVRVIATLRAPPTFRRLSGKSSTDLKTIAQKPRQPIPQSLKSPIPSPAEIPGAAFRAVSTILSRSLYWSTRLLKGTAEAVRIGATDPGRAKKALGEFWDLTKHELHHYWLGSKLFVTEVSTSTALVRKISSGEVLTWRERQQLRRTMGDLLRMVPFAIIVIIPFAEFSLPVLLKLFPNMLPSQFEKKEYRQEVYKKNLSSRLELHGILQEIVQDRMAEAASTGAPSATEMLQRIEDVRAGKSLPLDAIVSVAQLFRDDVTIENVPRAQLAAVAKYLQLSPFTPEPLLRIQLRMKLRAIKEDDALLAKEGTADLTPDELLAACEARGMRASGLAGGDAEYRQQLDDWLTLSVAQQVPAVLLVLTRALSLASGSPAASPAIAASLVRVGV
jgi:LETM1 and EF-hand domain-containing protein 1, mitochondrial